MAHLVQIYHRGFLPWHVTINYNLFKINDRFKKNWDQDCAGGGGTPGRCISAVAGEDWKHNILNSLIIHIYHGRQVTVQRTTILYPHRNLSKRKLSKSWSFFPRVFLQKKLTGIVGWSLKNLQFFVETRRRRKALLCHNCTCPPWDPRGSKEPNPRTRRIYRIIGLLATYSHRVTRFCSWHPA